MYKSIAASILALYGLFGSAHAGPFYWADVQGPSGTHDIKRANADGSGIQTMYSGLHDPRGIALDTVGGQMYWMEPGALAIQRASINGSGPIQTVAATDDGAADVVLDVPNGKMYWTDVSGTQIALGGLSGRVRSANLDGSNAETLVSNLFDPVNIALDPLHGKVYWTNMGANPTIERANLNGSDPETILNVPGSPSGLALDTVHEKLYWSVSASGSVQRANLDGTGVETVMTGLSVASNIDLDLSEGKLYWTDFGLTPGSGQIGSVNFDGSGRELLVAGAGNPGGFAVTPEPSSVVLAALGLLGLVAWGRRRRKRAA